MNPNDPRIDQRVRAMVLDAARRIGTDADSMMEEYVNDYNAPEDETLAGWLRRKIRAATIANAVSINPYPTPRAR